MASGSIAMIKQCQNKIIFFNAENLLGWEDFFK